LDALDREALNTCHELRGEDCECGPTVCEIPRPDLTKQAPRAIRSSQIRDIHAYRSNCEPLLCLRLLIRDVFSDDLLAQAQHEA
jgi:hypothetical protein